MTHAIHTLFEIYPADPLATTPLGLRVNELVYGRLDGADPVTGVVAGDARQQVETALAKLRALIDGAGETLAQIEKLTVVYESQASLGLLPECLAASLPELEPIELSESVDSLPPGRFVELHCLASLPNAGAEATAWSELSIGDRTVGMRMGPVAFAPMLLPRQDAGLDDTSVAHLRSALETAGDFLEAADSTWSELARATVFMSPVDMRALNTAWAEVFPDPEKRPPHKYVPVPLPEGCLAAVQVMAIVGAAPPQVIELETIHHGDWMTMAARTGNVVTSSRIIAPRVEDAGDYTRTVADGIEEILRQAGGALRDLTQVTAFIGQPAYRSLVREEFQRRLGPGAPLPVFHFIEADIGGVKSPRMEILALISGDQDL